MSWGIVATAGASLIGGKMASDAAKKGSRAEQAGIQAGIDSEERMFDKSLELMAPYRESGYSAIEGLNEMNDPTRRAALLKDYYAGDEFANNRAMSEEQQLRNSAATGGIRGGGNQYYMDTIAPSLGADYMNNRRSELTSMANMGMGAAGQGSSQASQMGGRLSSLNQSSGQAAAANSLAQANIWGNVASDIGGLGYDYFNKG